MSEDIRNAISLLKENGYMVVGRGLKGHFTASGSEDIAKVFMKRTGKVYADITLEILRTPAQSIRAASACDNLVDPQHVEAFVEEQRTSWTRLIKSVLGLGKSV